MRGLYQIISGEWQANRLLTDYRSQLLDKMFVERATWTRSAPVKQIGDTVIAAPGYVWVRFWLLEGEEPVDKYFDSERRVVGFYVPLCSPLQRKGAVFSASTLHLALWLLPDGRLTVMGEAAFEAASATGELTPVEVEHAEYRIRVLTLEINQKRYPPGIVRTFGLSGDMKSGAL
jgi:predicted RNA-binding protein associated with RNAse of E/G family